MAHSWNGWPSKRELMEAIKIQQGQQLKFFFFFLDHLSVYTLFHFVQIATLFDVHSMSPLRNIEPAEYYDQVCLVHQPVDA